MLVQLVRKSSNIYTVYNFTKPVQMSHLEYITTHNFYLQAIFQNLLQEASHLHPPPLPVTFLLFLHQYCGIV